MRLLMIGISHRTAAVATRERVALDAGAVNGFLDRCRERYPAAEFVVLSTCNRTEVYVARSRHDPPGRDQIIATLAETTGADRIRLDDAATCREEAEALEHLFRVATGLDSMVVGETQILGQVRRAYGRAADRDAVGPAMHRFFQQALASARQIRAATGIDAGRALIGSVAADFARQIFSRFDDKSILCIGAGELAKATLRHLVQLEPRNLWLVNRTHEHAVRLAEQLRDLENAGGPGGPGARGSRGAGAPGSARPPGASAPGPLAAAQAVVRPWKHLDDLLVDADILVYSAAAGGEPLDAPRIGAAAKRRRGRPLHLIDLAVPRGIDPAVGRLANVYLFNIDDLETAAARTQDDRREKVAQAEQLIGDAARSTLSQVRNRDVAELIRRLRDRLATIAAGERRRAVARLETGRDPEAVLDEHTHRLINKILHVPLRQLDGRDADSPVSHYAAALRHLFELDAPAPVEPPDAADAEPDDAGEPQLARSRP